MKFVTIVNEKYLPGLYALLQSLEDNGGLPGNTGFLILYTEPSVLKHSRHIRRFRFDFEFMDIQTLGHVTAPLASGGINHFGGVILQKLLIFNIPQKSLLCWMDADMICLNSVRELLGMSHFTAVASNKKRFADGQKSFNSGLMVFRPSSGLFNEILDFIRASDRPFKHGDQGVLNRFFYEKYPYEIRILDKEWNLSQKTEFGRPHQFVPSKIKILHFLGKKPWRKGFFRSCVVPSLRFKRLRRSQVLWWKYYLRSRIKKMRFFHP